MTKRELHVGMGTAEKFGKAFINAWKQGEQGTAKEIQAERIYFLELSTLLGTLTQKRLEILQALQHQPGITTYKLAKRLGRHYKNVHTDVKLLKEVGLIATDNEGSKLWVPFSKIQAEIDLAA